MAQDMGMETTNQEGQEVIQIHLHVKFGAGSLNGPTKYLLVLLLCLMQALKESYIGRTSMTGSVPYLPQGGIPALGSKAMCLTTTEDKAIYTIRDVLTVDMYPEQSLKAIEAPAIYLPRMMTVEAVRRPDALMNALSLPLQPTVLHTTDMMIL